MHFLEMIKDTPRLKERKLVRKVVFNTNNNFSGIKYEKLLFKYEMHFCEHLRRENFDANPLIV